MSLVFGVDFNVNFNRGKSESITITNEKGRLSTEEIDRMVAEAEQFASEDEAQRKRIEALNSLSSFVYGLKTQLGDQEGLGGKISDEDKKLILSTVKETMDWIDENGASASVEDLEEKLAGAFCFRKAFFFTVNS
jgi:endoplasmic reticulum chaperone BiP